MYIESEEWYREICIIIIFRMPSIHRLINECVCLFEHGALFRTIEIVLKCSSISSQRDICVILDFKAVASIYIMHIKY